MDKKFNFVVAKFWEGNSGALCVYSYGLQVQYGTQKQAEAFLKYVQSKDKGNYKIYKIE